MKVEVEVERGNGLVWFGLVVDEGGKQGRKEGKKGRKEGRDGV